VVAWRGYETGLISAKLQVQGKLPNCRRAQGGTLEKLSRKIKSTWGKSPENGFFSEENKAASDQEDRVRGPTGTRRKGRDRVVKRVPAGGTSTRDLFLNRGRRRAGRHHTTGSIVSRKTPMRQHREKSHRSEVQGGKGLPGQGPTCQGRGQESRLGRGGGEKIWGEMDRGNSPPS